MFWTINYLFTIFNNFIYKIGRLIDTETNPYINLNFIKTFFLVLVTKCNNKDAYAFKTGKNVQAHIWGPV